MLGKKVKDKITGFEGICTSVTTYVNGCVRVGVTPRVKDGKVGDSCAFDAEQIVVTGDGPVIPKLAHEANIPTPRPRSGGDRPGIAAKFTPKR